MGFPRQLLIEVTSECGEGCRYCRTPSCEKAMSPEMFKKVADEVSHESPGAEISLQFQAEKTSLWHRLLGLVGYARQVGCERIVVQTDPLRVEPYVCELAALGAEKLILSLPPDVRLTVKLTRISSVLNRILLLKEKHDLEKPLIELQLSRPPHSFQDQEIVRRWRIGGIAIKEVPLAPEEVVSHDEAAPCLWSLETCGIHWNGNVVTCRPDWEGKYVAGNVMFQSLASLWREQLRWLKETYAERQLDGLPEICRNCPAGRAKIV